MSQPDFDFLLDLLGQIKKCESEESLSRLSSVLRTHLRQSGWIPDDCIMLYDAEDRITITEDPPWLV